MTGDVPAIELPLIARFAALHIPYEVVRHAPVATVEEARRVRGDLDVCHVKNLFLRDKKGQMWLVTVERDQPVDLKALRRAIGASGALTFASHERLRTWLGVEPGSVTPLAAMNDGTGKVRVVLDETVVRRGRVAVHPLHNEATLTMSTTDLVRFLDDTGHRPAWVRFEEGG
jgi:Ala-tRNA(Pro) deacylase